jgi:CrcB protein
MIKSLKNFMFVGCGGFIGAVLRYLISGWTQQLTRIGFFPIGTVIVNILGCFILGILGGLAENLQLFNSNLRLFLFIGVLGSFTTFSTFSFETIALMRDGELFYASINILAQLVLGLGLAFLGFQITFKS